MKIKGYGLILVCFISVFSLAACETLEDLLGLDEGLGQVKLGSDEIGGLVWFDDNDNGLQDKGEEPAPGIVVQLKVYMKDAGPNERYVWSVVDTKTTDEKGFYIFDVGDLVRTAPWMKYAIHVFAPEDSLYSSEGKSPEDLNSDVGSAGSDQNLGWSNEFRVSQVKGVLRVDAGIVRLDRVEVPPTVTPEQEPEETDETEQEPSEESEGDY